MPYIYRAFVNDHNLDSVGVEASTDPPYLALTFPEILDWDLYDEEIRARALLVLGELEVAVQKAKQWAWDLVIPSE